MTLVALHVKKIPLPEMQPYRALMSENSTATKTAAVIFCCCCSASRMRYSKMWQEKTEATAAGFQDCPRETKIHRGCCLLLWVELLLPSRQEGVFWRTNNATIKARTMPMAPAATLSTERQLAWSQGHHSVQQQRVMVKMMLWCCGGEKVSKADAPMLTWHIA